MIARRRWMGLAAAGAGVALAPGLLHAQTPPASALAQVRQRSRLAVAVYQDMPPFVLGKDAREGIDVALAGALAAQLGVAPSLLPFPADENVGDDLRHMVWRGHYLGFGPADVMLHVPVERPLMAANPRVEIFAPYWRERIVVARALATLPRLDSLDDFGSQRIAVEGLSLAGWLLLGAESGRLRNQLTTKLDNGVMAAQALQRGEVAAAAGLASEIEATLGKDPRFAVGPLPLPQARDGWAVGLAVKKESTDLAQALQAGVNALVASGEMAAIFGRHGVTWRPV